MTMLITASLSDWLAQNPYQTYSYSYPHKTAYRPLATPVSLTDLWAAEKRDALFLYIHIPFCEMRCGFCNLFTTVNPGGDAVEDYLAQLGQQARQVRETLGDNAQAARFAIGGGTPTYLSAAQLERLLDLMGEIYALDLTKIPSSVETSPATATADKLHLLRQRGVERISIGIQSFTEAEVRAAGRPQRTSQVETTLDRIKSFDFPTLNLDLIYGLPGQTVESWLASLKRAIAFAPEELYLYPLYVRPLTGLGRHDRDRSKAEADLRLECYRAGRDFLEAAGYEQLSMRMFRLKAAPDSAGPVYCCQQDGMVGLGCGARSYTQGLHYSSEYGVSAGSVRAILADYLRRPAESFGLANYGYVLDREDQQRRYMIQSLLQLRPGLEFEPYQTRFGTTPLTDYPQLNELVELELAALTPAGLQLTAAGLERSDTLGVWLYSAQVRGRMEEYELR